MVAMCSRVAACAVAVSVGGLLSVAVSSAAAAVVFTNGSFVTSTTLGTGVTAGDPISQPEGFSTSGGLISTTAGISVKAFRAADDFVLYEPTDLSSVTVYAFQSQSSTVAGTKVPTVTSGSFNLWTVMPGTPDATPVLLAPLTLTPTSSTFAAWRQSSVPGTTNGTRPVFGYTFSLDGLPNGGLLGPGVYWLEWQLDNGVSANLFSPLVTPRNQAYNRNFRLYGVPFTGAQPQWFESWEGGNPNFPAPFAVPLVLEGQVVPEPASAAVLIPGAALLRRRRRV